MHFSAAATDGDHGEISDEEQGGQHAQHRPAADKGIFYSPGQPYHMRSRQYGPEPNGQYTQHSYAQYSQPDQHETIDKSPIQYSSYAHGEGLTRSPSINMDWQTLRQPR